MTAWIDAFLPTFGLIALGYLLRRTLLPDPVVWSGIESLSFRILLPALLASSISTVKLADLPLGQMAGAIWITLATGTASAIGIARVFRHDRAAMTSVMQGGIRFNNYVAFPIAAGLYGPAGLALAGVSAGLIVPCVQLILTFVFVLSEGRRLSGLGLVRQVVLNPLILGCLLGFAFAGLGGMPPGIAPFARSLGQAALALGLLCVGAGLSPEALREDTATHLVVAAQKLVAVPLLTLLLAKAFGLGPVATGVAVITMAMPTATTSYVMARAMGGDARLMATSITLQHLLAIASLPLWALALAG